MKVPIYQVDAFTSRLFGGNPAAVVLLDEWLPDLVMQNIGRENNLSETAFVIPREDQSELRWFTPRWRSTCADTPRLQPYIQPSLQVLNQVQFRTQASS
jgi:PhzF family phenazine biosynthesis protein